MKVKTGRVVTDQSAMLAMLRDHDVWRKWQGLQDSRVCLMCGNQISGEKIRITAGPRNQILFCCPTEGCNGSLREFAFTGNPLLEQDSWDDWMRTLDRDHDAVHG